MGFKSASQLCINNTATQKYKVGGLIFPSKEIFEMFKRS